MAAAPYTDSEWRTDLVSTDIEVGGFTLAGDDDDDYGGSKPQQHISDEEEDAVAAFTAPQEVNAEEFDAVQTLLAQAKKAKMEAKQLTTERRKMEKQVKALLSLNEQLRAKNSDLQKEADEMKQEQLKKLVEANARLQKSKGNDPTSQKKQEELQRALEGAEGYLLEQLEDEGLTNHRQQEKTKSRLERFFIRTNEAIARWRGKMGHSDLRYVEARYGQGIAVYFQFSQWLWMLNVLTVVPMAAVVGLQIFQSLGVVEGKDESKYETWMPAAQEMATVIPLVTHVPYFFLFSFVNNGYVYVSALVALCVFLVYSAAHKYAVEKGEEKAEQVYSSADDNTFSRLAFAGWDFNLMDAAAVEDAKIQASEDMQMKLSAHEVEFKRQNRTKQERRNLLFRRAFGIFMNLVLSAVAWGVIYLANDYTDKATGFLKSVTSVMPLMNIALSLVNAIFPPLTNALVKFERWDDMATQFKMETARLYLGKILNLLVLMYTSANSFVGGARMGLSGLKDAWAEKTCDYGQLGAQCAAGKSCWRCPEDELGWILFKTLILDFVASKVVAVLTGEMKVLLSKVRKDPGKAKDDFQTSGSVIQLLYIQAVAWLAIPYLPVVVVWQPIVSYINFKWDRWVLTRYKRKPVRGFEARKAQAFISNFFVLSLMIVMTNYYLFITSESCPIPEWHTIKESGNLVFCANQANQGPFNSKRADPDTGAFTDSTDTPCYAGNTEANTTHPSTCATPAQFLTPQNSNPGYTVSQILSSPFFAYVLAVVTWMKFKLEKRHRQYTTTFSSEKLREMQEQLSMLSMQLRKKDARIEYLEKHKKRSAAGVTSR